MSVYFRDADEITFNDALTPSAMARIGGSVVSELGAAVRRLICPQSNREIELAPEVASPTIRTAMAALEERLRHQASYYSPIRWIWSIRRLPVGFFAGELTTTAGYDQLLAEVLTGASTAPDDHRVTQAGEIKYEVRGAYPRRVAELCEGARFLSGLHSALRWAGKGARLELGTDGRFRDLAAPALVEAVSVYDRRVACPRSIPGGSPAGTVAIEDVGAGDSMDGAIAFVAPLLEPVDLPVKPPVVPVAGHVVAKFVLQRVTVARLMQLLDDPRVSAGGVPPPELGDLLLLSRSVLVHVGRFPKSIKTFLERGYLLTHRERIEATFRDMLAGGDELTKRVAQVWGARDAQTRLRSLAGASGSTWPLQPGPVVRMSGDVTCVDLLGLSRRLETLLQPPHVQGEAANARADHFEESTQDLLDRTPWAPPGKLRELRGRTLRIDGRSITDIDALAARSDTLLLVSCKSIRYTSGYDVGDYREVRNAESTVMEALTDWRQKMSVLRSSPHGDNYDFSMYRHIIGVVCTPMVVFLRAPQSASEASPGLPEASSLDELLDWLQRPA